MNLPMNRYRRHVLTFITEMLGDGGPMATALDFGAGDGWFAAELSRLGLASNIRALDVGKREGAFFDVGLYEGTRLPFEDGAFDLVYAIDALHHCRDPLGSLDELIRCCRSLLLLKDHTHSSWVGKAALIALDEVGNFRRGVACPRNYQRRFEWVERIESRGLRRVAWLHPAPVHPGLLGRTTNGLQFIGLWKKEASHD